MDKKKRGLCKTKANEAVQHLGIGLIWYYQIVKPLKPTLMKLTKTLLHAFCLVVLMALTGHAQNTTVSGKVLSAKDRTPLPGVAVMEKGTSNGTTTNANGIFSFRPSRNGATLRLTYLGMKPTEVTAQGSVMEILMEGDATQLGEVVISALGIDREKRSIGYSVERVSGSDLKESGETNLISAMSAKAAGVQVTQSSGAAGAASYIKIRGNASFTANDNQPLFVVDGVPIDNSQLNTEDLRGGVSLSNRAIDINPNDIADISILKGGAAAALYGTRGANGVVLITTKKGSFNQPLKVEFNSSMEMTNVNKLPELQTTYSQGIGSAYRSIANGNSTPLSWGPKISDLGFGADGKITSVDSLMRPGSKGTVPSFNNTESFFQTGFRFNNNLAISGGNEKNTYYLSIGNLLDNGIIPLNTFSRTSVKASGSARVSNRLKLSSSITFTNSKGQRMQQGSNTSGLMLGLLRTSPSFDNGNGDVSDPADPKSYLMPDGTQRRYHTTYDNPYWTINRNPFNDNVNRSQGYVQADYQATDWLNVMYRFGMDNYSDRRTQVFAKQSRNAVNGRIIEDVYNWTEYNSDLIATAKKDFGKLSTSLLAGWNVNQRNLDNVYVQGDGFALEGFNNMSNAGTVISTQGLNRRRLAGVYSELTLGYDDQYYLTATARGDQASTFGDVSQTIFYPSVSGSWVFTQTLGLSNNMLTSGKLRGSWAKVGLEPAFGSNRTYYERAGSLSGWIDGVQFPFGTTTGFSLSNVLGNPALRPEFTATTEFGLDLGLFKNKLNLEFTYYNQQSQDLIVAVPISGSTGFTNSYQNVGKMENKGIELNARYNLINTNDLSWNVGMVFTRNRNKVIELAEGVDVIDLPWGFFGANQRLVKGEAYGTLYGDDWERDANGNALVDADGYPVYSPTEVVVGNPNPDWLMGINSDLRWKNWTFDMLWDIRQGGDIWNGTRGALYYFGTHADVGGDRDATFVWEDVKTGNSGVYAPGTTINGVDVSGQANTTAIPANHLSYANGPLSGFTGASSPFIEDGSWVRLRQLSANYSLPSSVYSKFSSLKGLTLGITGRNLLLFTNYKGVDPETNLSGSTNSQGADYFNMPNTRGVIFSLKANF